jgi:hypothetical protein
MSIWMILVFAICMLSAVLSFGATPAWGNGSPLHDTSWPLFLLALAIFVSGVVTRGIRRPVV